MIIPFIQCQCYQICTFCPRKPSSSRLSPTSVNKNQKKLSRPSKLLVETASSSRQIKLPQQKLLFKSLKPQRSSHRRDQGRTRPRKISVKNNQLVQLIIAPRSLLGHFFRTKEAWSNRMQCQQIHLSKTSRTPLETMSCLREVRSSPILTLSNSSLK